MVQISCNKTDFLALVNTAIHSAPLKAVTLRTCMTL